LTAPSSGISDENIVGDISFNTLAAELSESAARSAMRHVRIRSDGVALIPSYEDLRVGDVILSRPLSRKWPTAEIETTQKKYGCNRDCCCWTHAMLYVGQLHVAESNKPYAIKTGVGISPLTAHTGSSEFLVLRYRDAEFRATRRQSIARYALLNPTINPRRYDVRAAIGARLRRRPTGVRHAEYVNCSEFVLECFAIAGPYLIQSYLQIQNERNSFFFPAHLADDSNFEQFPMKYYKLVWTQEKTLKPVSGLFE
jgi:hypothetical protein